MAGLDDDSDAEEGAIAAKGAVAFAKHLAAAEADEGTVTVQDEPEVEDDEELDETPKAPSRAERRASRTTARERAAAAEAREAVLREQLDEARRNPRMVTPPVNQGNPVEAIDAKIRQTFLDEKALNEEWTAKYGKVSAAEIQRMEDRAAEISVARISLVADRKAVLEAPQRAQQQRADAQRSRFPDVFAEPRAFQYAQAEYNLALARGEKPTQELEDAAFKAAREVILGKKPAPGAGTRARARGMASGARAAATETPKQLAMPKGGDYDRMARAAFPNLEPAQARQKWANTVGKKLLARQG